LNTSGKCVKCGRNQVFDTFTKKCYHAKPNPYVEIHHDKSLPKITTSGVYGFSQNRTGVIELELEYMREERQKKLKRTKFGSQVRPEKLSVKIEIISPSYTRNMTIADIPTSFKRSISFRTLIPANESLKFITHINTEEKAHYLYYSLMRVKYTLVKMQKEGEMDIHLGPSAEDNRPVSAKEVARFSRGIAVKEIDEFEKLYEFDIGKELEPELTNIAEWNEQDELNGNWITTWFKINRIKPANSDRVTLISLRFMLEEETE